MCVSLGVCRVPRWGVCSLWYQRYRCKGKCGESFGEVSPAPYWWAFWPTVLPTGRFSAPCTVGGCTADIVGPGTRVPTTENISIYIVGCTVHCITERGDDRGRMVSAPLSRQWCTRVHCLSRMPISTTSSFADGALRAKSATLTCAYAYARPGAIPRARVRAEGGRGGTPESPPPAHHPYEPPRACACVTNKLEAP